MGGMGAAGAFGQPQAQAQGQQGQGKINFQDPFLPTFYQKNDQIILHSSTVM